MNISVSALKNFVLKNKPTFICLQNFILNNETYSNFSLSMLKNFVSKNKHLIHIVSTFKILLKKTDSNFSISVLKFCFNKGSLPIISFLGNWYLCDSSRSPVHSIEYSFDFCRFKGIFQIMYIWKRRDTTVKPHLRSKFFFSFFYWKSIL